MVEKQVVPLVFSGGVNLYEVIGRGARDYKVAASELVFFVFYNVGRIAAYKI